jgi:hypothetical protein
MTLPDGRELQVDPVTGFTNEGNQPGCWGCGFTHSHFVFFTDEGPKVWTEEELQKSRDKFRKEVAQPC